MAQKNEICLFLHIPKAAGTTLQTILSHNFPPGKTWIIDSNRPNTAIRYFSKLTAEEKQRFVAFRGHMAFGTHQFLDRDFTYVTLLRHPVDRMISHYYYVKQCGPAHYLFDQVHRNKYSLAQYVRSGISPELDNGQVRLLTDTENTVPIGGMTREHLEQAKQNLVRYFGVVGTVDRFDEFLIMLRKRFALPSIEYDRENVTKSRPRLKDLPESDRQAILEVNQLDEELYRFAQDLMTSQIQVYGPDFIQELREFRTRQQVRRRLAETRRRFREVLAPVRHLLESLARPVLNALKPSSRDVRDLTPAASLSNADLPCCRKEDR